MSSNAREFLKSAGLKASIVEDGVGAGEVDTYVDTGCYMLNALCSTSIYGGIPAGRVTMLAGDPATGKSYIALMIAENFQKMHPNGVVAYAETEAAADKRMAKSRGLNTEQMILTEPDTIEKFRADSIKLLQHYLNQPDTEDEPRFPLLMILDSLSALFTEKELAESMKDDGGARDMTKAGIIRSTFHILTRRYLAVAKVPLVLTNHVYSSMNPYGEATVVSGGLGAVYAASTLLSLKKKKDYDKKSKEVVGTIITVTAKKSRMSIENSKIDMKLNYRNGLDKYYGLVDLGEKHGIFGKSGSYKVMPDGSNHYESAIYANPERFFTPDIMERLDAAAKVEFEYSGETAIAD